MKKHHPDNERIKRRYLDYLKEADGQTEASLDSVAKALSRFETSTQWRDFKAFRPEQAKSFKSRLGEQVSVRTGERLSKATLYSTLRDLRAFFRWLAGQPGYRSRLTYSDADYFNLSDNDTRIARARRETAVPTLEQISHVLATMPTETVIEMRNRALVAFTILTGARDGAMASLKLKHIDLKEGFVDQDAREVRTKRRRTFKTWFFPVGDEPLRIVTEWVTYLRHDLYWGSDDPLFPKTKVAVGVNRMFEAAGLEREHWATAAPIRDIFRDAFRRAGLPYFNPHSFRNTLAQHGQRLCRNPEAFKAWSQNLGHSGVLTTLTSYGQVSPTRQAQLIRSLSASAGTISDPMQLFQEMVRAEVDRVVVEGRAISPTPVR